MATWSGGCHCGAVRFELDADELAPLLACNCSICSMRGHVHWIVPRERFRLIRGADALTEYRFHTRTARHLFCATCGICSFYVPRSDPDKYDVNVRCLDGVDAATLRTEAFDGRNWEAAERATRGRRSAPDRDRTTRGG